MAGDTPAKKAWDAANTIHVGMKLNRNTDADIITHLQKQEAIQTYIKNLIRADIEKSK